MPEGVFCVEVAVFNRQVFHVLEGIFSFHLHVSEGNVGAVEKDVLACDGAVFQIDMAAFPAKFIRNDLAVFYGNVFAFADGFDAFDRRMGDGSVFRVPDRGSGEFVERRMA